MPPKLPDSMPWQIYQAYLGGPSALLRLFEDAFGRHALYGPPDADQQQQQIDDLSAHIGQLKSQVERLQAEVSELRGRNFQLGRRNAEREALITKDSHNSSRPPSTDPPWNKRTKSLRRPSGKRPGGQAGHRGETLRLVARPHRVVEHRPRECRGCHAPLITAQAVRHLRCKVKGGREETWPLPRDVKAAIDHYLTLDRKRREISQSDGAEAFLFQPHVNYRTLEFRKGISTRMVQKIVERWADYSRVGDLSPHDLRRTAITKALNSGLTYRQVQMMSKHKDPKTVMRYDHGRENLDQNAVNFLGYDDE